MYKLTTAPVKLQMHQVHLFRDSSFCCPQTCHSETTLLFFVLYTLKGEKLFIPARSVRISKSATRTWYMNLLLFQHCYSVLEHFIHSGLKRQNSASSQKLHLSVYTKVYVWRNCLHLWQHRSNTAQHSSVLPCHAVQLHYTHPTS